MPNTDSWLGLMRAVKQHLLTFEPIDGSPTLLERIGTAAGAGADGKLYIEQGPDPVVYPYGILHDPGSFVAGDDSGYQKRGVFECALFDYGRTKQAAVSGMADVVEQAWRDFVLTAIDDTIVAQRITIRSNVPHTEPATRDLVHIRLLLPFYATPFYQAQYSTAPTL